MHLKWKKIVSLPVVLFLILCFFCGLLPDNTYAASGINVTFSMIDPALKSQYSVNLPDTKDNALEYSWFVEFTDGNNRFRVATSHWKFPSTSPATMAPSKMQTNLWLWRDNSFSLIGSCSLSVNGTELTWKATIPSEYHFDSNSLRVLREQIVLAGKTVSDVPGLSSDQHNLKLGDTFLLGRLNGKSIKWVVQAVEGNHALLMCANTLDFVSIDPESLEGNCDETTLFNWCSSFCNSKSFSDAERNIISTTIIDSDHSEKLFILSADEYNQKVQNKTGRPVFPGVSGSYGAIILNGSFALKPVSAGDLTPFWTRTRFDQYWIRVINADGTYSESSSINLQQNGGQYGVCPAFYYNLSQSGNTTPPLKHLAVTTYSVGEHWLNDKPKYQLFSGVSVQSTVGSAVSQGKNGVAVVDYSGGTITAEKDKYISVTVPEAALNKSPKVYLYPSSDAPTVFVVRMDDTFNILNESCDLPLVDKKAHNLHVEVDWGNGNQKSLKLVQGSKVVSVQPGDNSIVWSDHFDLTQPIYIEAENDQSSNHTTRQKLGLSAKLNDLDGFSLSFGDTTSFTLPDSIPVVGGDELKTSLYAPVPIKIVKDNDKLYAAIGFQIDGTDDQSGEGSQIKTFAKSVKKLKENYGGKQAIKDFFQKNKDNISKHKGSYGVDVGFQFAGFMEGYYDADGKLHWLDSGLVFKLDGSISGSRPFLFPGLNIPCYGEGKFEAEAEAQLNLYLSEAAKKIMPDGTLEGKIALSIGAGVGVNKMLSIGGGITGAINRFIEHQSRIVVHDKASFTANGYLKATFLALEFKHPFEPFWDKTLYEYPATSTAKKLTTSAKSSSGDIYVSSNYIQPDLTYLDEGSVFHANDTTQRRMLKAAVLSSNSIAKTFLANSYQNAAPQIIALNADKMLAVWTGYDSARTGMDCLCLWYSYYNGFEWTEPAIVDDDGTMDANFTLMSANDSAYLAWMNSAGRINSGDTLSDISAQMDISAAVFDESTCSFTVTRLTEQNGTFDSMPVLCADDNTVTAVWVENEDNEVLTPTTNNAIYSCDLFEGVWGEQKALYTGLSSLDSIAADRSEGTLVVSYSMDIDGNQDTVEDLEIYTNGSAITNNDGIDSGVQYKNGTLYWYQSGTVVTNESPVVGAENGLTTDRFQMVHDNGVHAVVFVRNTGVTSALSAIFCDEETGAWGNAVDLTDDTDTIASFSACAEESNLQVMINRLSVGENDFSEGSIELLNFPLYSDLALDQVLFESADYDLNRSLPLLLQLSNSGKQAVHGFTVTVQNADGETLLVQSFDEVILPGESMEQLVNLPVIQAKQRESLTVTVSGTEENDFTAENNSQTITIEKNDIAVEHIGWGINESGKTIIYADVVNRGYTPSTPLTVSLRKDSADGTILNSVQTSSLDTQDLEHISFETSYTKDAVYFVTIDNVEDEDPTNNYDLIVIPEQEAETPEPSTEPTPDPSVEPTTQPKVGWQKIDGKWYYYNDAGEMQTGWLKQDGKWYFLDDQGVMRKGWVKTNGKWYYMDSHGVMVTGWKQIKEQWYYFDSHGAMVTGKQTIAGKQYSFDSSGVMQTGWKKHDGKWYYFESSGAAKTGWVKSDGKWYYMDNLGHMLTGWVYLEPERYYMDENGVMQTGWVKIDSKWYYFASNGKMVTGWQKINEKWYYFNADGSMRTGWLKSGGQWYYMESSGVMHTGWLQLKDKWYYFGSGGKMVTGTQVINGKTRTFDENGVWLGD